MCKGRWTPTKLILHTYSKSHAIASQQSSGETSVSMRSCSLAWEILHRLSTGLAPCRVGYCHDTMMLFGCVGTKTIENGIMRARGANRFPVSTHLDMSCTFMDRACPLSSAPGLACIASNWGTKKSQVDIFCG
ncbi:hypothetical protein BN1723_017702 [Verticillium longisporum]|uniref:Uncharacterized protein n=1 Tax=Verticillium longisporum TaxID=100787 RepID=A0A0G4L9R4_VERLO|nr:hypothetical protein BN1723_017702 [Verticillium longisporum]